MGTSADLNRILNVRVGRYFVCAKPPLRRAEARFGKPRKVPKGFNFVSGKVLFGWADSRFAKPRISLQGNVFWYFLRRAKSTAKTRRGLRSSGLRGRFNALPKKILAKFSGGTSRNRFFAQNGGEKALNRCEVRALQRKELERRLKEQPCSLVDSRLWLGGNLRCLWRKMVALENNMEGWCKKKAFGLWKWEIFEDNKARLVQKKGFRFVE